MPAAAARRVVIVAFPGVQALDVTGPHEVFAGATAYLAATGAADAGYDVAVAASTAGPVRSESGLAIVASALGDVADVDTLVVPGGGGIDAAIADAPFVRLRRRRGRPVPPRRQRVQRRLRARRRRPARRPPGDDALGPGASGSPACTRPCTSTPTRSGSATATCGRRPA